MSSFPWAGAELLLEIRLRGLGAGKSWPRTPWESRGGSGGNGRLPSRCGTSFWLGFLQESSPWLPAWPPAQASASEGSWGGCRGLHVGCPPVPQPGKALCNMRRKRRALKPWVQGNDKSVAGGWGEKGQLERGDVPILLPAAMGWFGGEWKGRRASVRRERGWPSCFSQTCPEEGQSLSRDKV